MGYSLWTIQTPLSIAAEVLLMIGRVKKRSAPALDKVPTGLLRSGQAAANVTFQVYPDIWRHGTSTVIWEDQRTFRSRRGTGRRHEWQDHLLVIPLSNVSLEEPGTNSKEKARRTRGNVTNLRMVRGKAGEPWLSASSAFDSVGHDTLRLMGLRTEGQTQMLWWMSSATGSNWFGESPKINGKSINNMRVQII